MRIENEKVIIKVGKMQYDLQNLILDQYLQRFVTAQMMSENPDASNVTKDLKYCLLKFDTPIFFESSSIIYNQEFDAVIVFDTKKVQEVSEKQIVMQYLYQPTNIYDYSNDKGNQSISQYHGRRITALGFNTNWRPYDETTRS